MSETIGVNILKKAQSVDTSDQAKPYAGVRIYAGVSEDGRSDIVFESPDQAHGGIPENAHVLEINNPFGSQEMADNILAGILGYKYQPVSAGKALLDPAAELGDGFTVNGVYSGIFVRATQFGKLMASDISAPTNEEIEHEFMVESSASDRQYTRFVKQMKSSLSVTASEIRAEVAARTEADEEINGTLAVHATDISARVTKQGSNGNNTFAWSLDSDGFYIHNGEITDSVKQNKSALFTFTSSGLSVKGEIRATSGKIGNFDIGQNELSYNGLKWGDTNKQGAYIGSSGIQLGSNFSVDTSGTVTATGIKLTGDIYFYNAYGNFLGSLGAGTLMQGASDGYNWSNGSYGGASSRASYSLTGGGYGYNYDNATKSGTDKYPSYFKAGTLYNVNRTISIYNQLYSAQSVTVYNTLGTPVTLNYLGY